MQLWSARIPETGTAARQAVRAEQEGWDGVTFTDSQNLVGDPFVAVALAAAATARLRFATGVTNAFTRHPAALANVAATVQEESGGRFVLGIGRGDTALFHLGRPPMPVARFVELTSQVQTYLGGGTVDCEGFPSRLLFLDRASQPKVPLDIACSGPRLLEFATRTAERVTLAVGADPDRVRWALDVVAAAATAAGRDPAAIDVGAYVTVGCHPDVDEARAMVAGSVAAFAHFSAMPGSTGAGLADGDREVVATVGARYDSRQHLSNHAPHADLPAGFVDRFAVVGPPERCVERLLELAALGIGRVVVTGPGFGADRDAAHMARRLVVDEVLPAVRDVTPVGGT